MADANVLAESIILEMDRLEYDVYRRRLGNPLLGHSLRSVLVCRLLTESCRGLLSSADACSVMFSVMARRI
jgi:hypothetical protein